MTRCTLVVQQRTVGDGNLARAAVDGKAPARTVGETVRQRITRIDVGPRNSTDHRAIRRILNHGI